MSARTIETNPEIIALAVDLARQGKRLMDIKAELKAKYAGQYWDKNVSHWTAEAREEYRRNKADATGYRSEGRFSLVLYPEGYDYESPYLRNLFAHMAPGSGYCPWMVFRSPVFEGRRCYRVVPESQAPFQIWAKSLAEFVHLIRRRGLNVALYDPEEYDLVQVDLFDAAPGRRMAA